MSVARGHSQSFQEVWSGVPAVCFPVDEQSSDEGVATPLHYPSLGHLPGKAGCPPLSELLWAMNTSHSCLRQFAAVSVSASASVVQLILCSVGQDEEISWNLVMCIWDLWWPYYTYHTGHFACHWWHHHMAVSLYADRYSTGTRCSILLNDKCHNSNKSCTSVLV